MILLASLISVTALAQEQVILKKSQLAPFKGILVPEDTYKKMFADIETKDFLQKALEEKTYDYVKLEESASTKQNYFFGAGALLGVIATIAIKGR